MKMTTIQLMTQLIEFFFFSHRLHLAYSNRVVLLVKSFIKASNVFEPRTEILSEHFACQESGLFQISTLTVSTTGEMLENINVVARRKVKQENSLLPFAVRRSKTSPTKALW